MKRAKFSSSPQRSNSKSAPRLFQEWKSHLLTSFSGVQKSSSDHHRDRDRVSCAEGDCGGVSQQQSQSPFSYPSMKRQQRPDNASTSNAGLLLAGLKGNANSSRVRLRLPTTLIGGVIAFFLAIQGAVVSDVFLRSAIAPLWTDQSKGLPSSWQQAPAPKIRCPNWSATDQNLNSGRIIFLSNSNNILYHDNTGSATDPVHEEDGIKLLCHHASFQNEINVGNETRRIQLLQPEYSSMDDSSVKMPKNVLWVPLNDVTREALYYDITEENDRSDILSLNDQEESKVPGVGYFKPPELLPTMDVDDKDESSILSNVGACKPMAEWQTKSYMNCNTFHETDMYTDFEQFLNHGEYRDVWKVSYRSNGNNFSKEPIVLKTLRLADNKYFTAHRAEQHRVDAMASERLTSSRNVASIYGFCGQSAMNEIATPTGRVLVKGARKLNNHIRLVYSLDVARGVAAAHGIEQQQHNNTNSSSSNNMASLVHRDIRSTNFLIKAGHMILHDFNCARFVTMTTFEDEETGSSSSSCGFYKHECGHDRSPEECWGQMLSEKIDIYSMANVFYTIVTGFTPYTYPEKVTLEQAGELVKYGHTPHIPLAVQENPSKAIQGILKVMKECWSYHPKDRPTAAQVARELQALYDQLYGNRPF
jgi:hypothetical protein